MVVARTLIRNYRLLRALVASVDVAESSDSVLRVSGETRILEMMDAIAQEARSEVLSATPDSWVHDAFRPEFPAPGRLLVSGSRNIRVLQTLRTARDPRWRVTLEKTEASGVHMRIADELPHRLVVADRTVAFLPADPVDRDRGALLIREPALVHSLVSQFAAHWRSARSLAEANATSEAAYVPELAGREVLRMIAAGVTDENAARDLGISVRTYRRRIAAIMELLGATTRFQAGVRAVERGWI